MKNNLKLGHLRRRHILENLLRINLKWGNRSLYYHSVRSYIANLRQTGELVRVSRGCYSLTDKGIRRLNSLIPLLRELREGSKKVGLIKGVDEGKDSKV